MNKDFKTILMLWIASIIISGLALYSFRDVKFSNTKKLKEQAQEQTETLQQEYQDLLSNTSSASNILSILEEDNALAKKTTGELSITMLDFFVNDEFIKIKNTLKQQEINTNFQTVENFSTYKNLIKSGLNTSDIYLIPSDRLKNLEVETINIWENPKPYFHSIFNNLVTSTDNKYIPYAIDPIITLTKATTNIWSNRESLFSHTTLRTQPKKYAMPLIRWIWKNDIRLLERWEWPFENYFDILYQHIKQIQNTNQVSELKNMLDTEKITLDYKYNFVTFKQLTDTINKRDPNCKLFPAICLMSYNFGDIKFGFLSDLDILDTYFSWNQNDFRIKNFNSIENSYPVRWRVFVIAKNSPNINLANKFFQQYLSESINNNTGLRNNTLSAINNIYDLQKNTTNNNSKYNIYEKILQNENNFSLIYENIDLQEDFLKNTNTVDMLKWNYSPEIYLK